MKYYLDANFLKNLNSINETYRRIFEPIAESIHTNQEIYERMNSSVEEASRIFSQNINTIYKNISTSYIKQLQTVNLLSPAYIKAINNIYSVTEPLAKAFRSIDFDSFFTSVQSENSNKDFNDYITTDSRVIREIDLSDGIAIPVGNNRIKIKTDTFLTLLSVLFTIFTFLFQNIGNKASEEDTNLLLEQNQLSQEQVQLAHRQNHLLQEQNQLAREQNQLLQEQNQLTQEQNLLLWEQNRILLEILESVDASESSQAEFFNNAKESLQKQTALFQMLLEASESNQLSSDTVQEATDLTQEATDLTQKADDPIRPTTDTFPPTPSNDHDNE